MRYETSTILEVLIRYHILYIWLRFFSVYDLTNNPEKYICLKLLITEHCDKCSLVQRFEDHHTIFGQNTWDKSQNCTSSVNDYVRDAGAMIGKGGEGERKGTPDR